MDAASDHVGFIIAAYLATVLVLGLLIGWIIADGRAQKRRLAELEARGIKRRSGAAAS